MKNKLAETEALLASIVNSSDDGILSKDLRGIITSWNQGAQKMFGYSASEIVGKHISILIPGHLKEEENDIIEKIHKGEFVDHYETKRITRDGRLLDISLTISPLRNAQGVITGASKILRDISHSKAVEEKLMVSDARFRHLLDNMLEGAQIIDFTWKYIYVNNALVRHGKYSREALLGYTMMEKYPGIEQTDMFAIIRRCMQERVAAQLETEFLFPDGSKGNFELSVQPVDEGIFILSIDITERKKAEREREEAEAELKKSEKLFRSIALHIPKSLVIVMGKDHRFLIIEGELMERMGYKRQDYEGKHPLEIAPKEQYETSRPLYERVFNGEQFSVDRSLSMGDFIIHFVPMKDETGAVESAMIIALDISEIRKAQRDIEELNVNLERKVSERTAQLDSSIKELESFSYSVSHDLRAPLRAIHSYTAILEEEYSNKLDEEGIKIIEVILRNSRVMGELIDDLLTFSRLGRKEISRMEIPMNSLVKSVSDEFLSAPSGNKITFTIRPLPPAEGDKALIKQVWVNLISNAVKYASRQPEICIEIGSYVKEGQNIYFIKDNGVGFDMKYYHKLFGVFQRLHSQEEFEGTGVGLATTQRIVKKHRGEIWAEAAVNEGATFHFSLSLN